MATSSHPTAETPTIGTPAAPAPIGPIPDLYDPALTAPVTPPAPGTRARYVGSLTDYYGAPVIVGDLCPCLSCLLDNLTTTTPRVDAWLPGHRVRLWHVRLTSLRVLP